MSRADFIGIDLTTSEAKGSACLGIDRDLNLTFAGFLGADADLVALVVGEGPCLVAIDAPLTLPSGLCCLEEGCACQPEGAKGRECERQLARQGISCYFTTKRSIIKGMTYRGIRLRGLLEERGCQVIEVYPYASKVCLWGKDIPPKSKAVGRAFLREKVASLIPSVAAYVAGFNHDLCDAAVAAYTAYLHHSNKTEPVGSLEEGVIWLPQRLG